MSFPRYERYKDSGVDWLGQVPEHWRLVPFWTRYRRTKRIGYPEEQMLSAYRDHGVVPKASRDDNNNKASEDLNVYQLVEPGDLVINKMKAWQGSVAISDHQGIVSPAYFVYAATHKDNPRYLHYLMRSDRYITGYLSLSKGVRIGQWDLDPIYHSRIPLLMPPLDEQNRIANLIDRETRKIDALIAEQLQLIELLKEKRQAVISHAVTKGLNPDTPMKDCGVDWIGLIPQPWGISKLGQMTNIVRGGSPRPAGDPRFFNGDFMPWITVGEVTKDDGMYLVTTESMLTEVGAEQSRTIDIGTLVLTNSGATLGVPKILGITGCANDGILAFLALNENVNKKYLYFVLGSLTSELRERMKQGSGQPNLNTGIVGALNVPLPPVAEQLAIVVELERMQDEFGALMAQAETSVTLLQERRSALISAAVTGKIDVRNYTPKEAA